MLVFDLLVIKTQGRCHHLISPRKGFQPKVKAEIVDVYALLDLALEEGVGYNDERAVSAIRHGVSLWNGRSCLRVGLCGGIAGGVNGNWPSVVSHSTFIVLLTTPAAVPYLTPCICNKFDLPTPAFWLWLEW